MAESPAHRFGQIIGDVLELAIEPLLSSFASSHSFYLDKKGRRPARRGKKVQWKDLNGNNHDLDYVLEKGGTPNNIGTPVAFIETAWRRYTKHSRNKAQEIQGAILPLAATYRETGPFYGAILAGVFTDGALTQLKSLGFSILFFPYDAIITAFGSVGIDAHTDESTPDAEIAKKVEAWDSLSSDKRLLIGETLLKLRSEDVNVFMETLDRTISRTLETVRILPLHGVPLEVFSIDEAIKIIEEYNEEQANRPVVRYEIELVYSNGDKIDGLFIDKTSAILFLRSHQFYALQVLPRTYRY